MKKILFRLVALLVVAAILGACAPAAAPAKDAASAEGFDFEMPDYPEPPEGTEMVDTTRFKKDPPWTIAYANASTSNSWRIFTVGALFWAAEEYPELIENIVHLNANDSIPKQISDMEDLIVQEVDAIILATTSGDGLNAVVDQAMEADIPVIILERGIASDNYVTFIDVDPPSIATNAAQYVVDALAGEGNVVWYGVFPGITLSEWQETAVKKVWGDNPGITDLAFDYGLVSRSKGKELMEAWLQNFPKIDGVLSWTGSEIEGAVEAAKEAGRFEEVKVWVGADEQGFLQMIKDGLPAAGYYGYADCTVDAVYAAIRILSGQPVPKLWRLPVRMITPENIDEYVIPGAPATWFPSRIPSDDVQTWLDLAATK
jgi:ribose transport system substrate-binding protein